MAATRVGMAIIDVLAMMFICVHAKGSSSVLLPATHTITKSSTTPAASTVTPTAVTTKAPTNSTPRGGTTVVQSPSHRSPTHTSQTKTTPGNHSTPTPTPTSSGNHSSTGKPTTNGNHSSTPTSPTPRGKPKGHDKGEHGDSRGKWVATGFAVVFGITTIVMTVLYCRQRKIYRELEGDSSLSRLI